MKLWGTIVECKFLKILKGLEFLETALLFDVSKF